MQLPVTGEAWRRPYHPAMPEFIKRELSIHVFCRLPSYLQKQTLDGVEATSCLVVLTVCARSDLSVRRAGGHVDADMKNCRSEVMRCRKTNLETLTANIRRDAASTSTISQKT